MTRVAPPAWYSATMAAGSVMPVESGRFRREISRGSRTPVHPSPSMRICAPCTSRIGQPNVPSENRCAGVACKGSAVSSTSISRMVCSFCSCKACCPRLVVLPTAAPDRMRRLRCAWRRWPTRQHRLHQCGQAVAWKRGAEFVDS